MEEFLAWFEGIPAPLVYAGLGFGAALENVVPAIPADTFVALGGVLVSAGDLRWPWVFGITWLSNVASALAVYRLGYVRGPGFFRTGIGRRLVDRSQLARMRRFYSRHGVVAIFFTRFLPGLRAVVPVFAGVSRTRWPAVAAPIFVASAIWYGALVGAGVFLGSRLDLLGDLLDRVNLVLVLIATAVTIPVVFWWWRTRRKRRQVQVGRREASEQE